jgi:hypothetical protein
MAEPSAGRQLARSAVDQLLPCTNSDRAAGFGQRGRFRLGRAISPASRQCLRSVVPAPAPTS